MPGEQALPDRLDDTVLKFSPVWPDPAGVSSVGTPSGLRFGRLCMAVHEADADEPLEPLLADIATLRRPGTRDAPDRTALDLQQPTQLRHHNLFVQGVDHGHTQRRSWRQILL